MEVENLETGHDSLLPYPYLLNIYEHLPNIFDDTQLL